MKGLTTALLGQACRIFLELAYPEGINAIPSPQNTYFSLRGDEPLEAFLVPPVCQPLPIREGRTRGYALRLGSTAHPYLKLQIVNHGDAACIFSVDTHDVISLESGELDSPGWVKFQQANRQLKERIERAWEVAGLLTFNSLLRRELAKK